MTDSLGVLLHPATRTARLLLVCLSALFLTAAADAQTRPPVYWLGESFEGLPIAGRSTHPPSFFYGGCQTDEQDDCPPEVQVQNWLLARRPPAQFDESIQCHRLTVRGVPAALWEGAGAFDIYTGDRTVTLFGDVLAQMRRAADALHPVDGVWTATLPAPTIDVRSALRRCAHDPFSPTALASKLEELNRWAGRRIYYAGRSFHGFPLARVYGTGRSARFIYGRCALRPTYVLDGPAACWLPLEIDTFPITEYNPSGYVRGVRCKSLTIRGAPAALFGTQTLHVYFGRKAVFMYGRRAHVLIAAARALRSLDGSSPPGERLPRPAIDVRAGIERCASAAGSLAG
ncbi:MAG TPA: hypothetical protein VG079_04350 [Gaiellaceae bacterium]|nr:hypothetical protein [Gaiellaceae bacterium]